jgi:hypothetical protein
MPTALQALPHDAQKPSDVHGLSSLFARMIVLRFGIASGLTLSGSPTGMANAPARLRLSQADGLAAMARPRKPEQIAPTLPDP